MTTEKKRARRSRIQRVKEHREAAGLVYATYWVARGSVDGQLEDVVSVWTARPDRHVERCPEVIVVHWRADEGHYFGQWTIKQAQLELGNALPATDLECVRIGPELPTT